LNGFTQEITVCCFFGQHFFKFSADTEVHPSAVPASPQLSRTLDFAPEFADNRVEKRWVPNLTSGDFCMTGDVDSTVGDLTLLSIYRSLGLQEGGEDAARKFTERYLDKLMVLIRANMSGKLQPHFDPEDVAQSVLNSWFGGVRGRGINPNSASEIWPLISVIALNKVRNRVRALGTLKQGGNWTRHDVELLNVATEPAAEDVVAIQDLLQELSNRLSPSAQEVLRLLNEGFSVREIAQKLDVVTRTVTRRKDEIRRQLLTLVPEDLRAFVERMYVDPEKADDAD
jgi:DNA-directed RNA polymerase specialized sigma24 family protein